MLLDYISGPGNVMRPHPASVSNFLPYGWPSISKYVLLVAFLPGSSYLTYFIEHIFIPKIRYERPQRSALNYVEPGGGLRTGNSAPVVSSLCSPHPDIRALWHRAS